MISQKILNILHKNSQFYDFMRNVEDFNVLVKQLNKNEIKRLTDEYPALLVQKELKNYESILCITLIKNNREVKNHFKLRKIKVYVDEIDEKIIKILKN